MTVTATHLTTKASQIATTGNDGNYSISVLPGMYSVSAAVQGFRRVVQDVDVSAGALKPLDFLLQTELTEELTVTATKREQAILDVPFSVAAPTEEALRMRGVDGIEGVAASVGGLTVQNLGPGQSQVAIRGVSAGQIVRDQPGVKEQVGVYLDESVISLSLFTPDLDLFDTRRVEVLRGPQGTLFGSGSLTGTVRYITNPPELNVTKTFAEFSLAGVDGGNAGLNGKFGFNAPLGDRAALRVVSYYDRIAGFIDAVQPDLPTVPRFQLVTAATYQSLFALRAGGPAIFRGTCREPAGPNVSFTERAFSSPNSKEIAMTQGFVWFHNSSDNPADSSTFYEKLLGWTPSEGPGGLTMLAGESGPFAGIAQKDGGAASWIPYAQVDDVDAATKRAQRLGATIVKAKARGPAGEFSVVRDPGGAAIALWQKA